MSIDLKALLTYVPTLASFAKVAAGALAGYWAKAKAVAKKLAAEAEAEAKKIEDAANAAKAKL